MKVVGERMRMIEERIAGEGLQRLMEEREVSQRELAERAEVDDSVTSLARRGSGG